MMRLPSHISRSELPLTRIGSLDDDTVDEDDIVHLLPIYRYKVVSAPAPSLNAKTTAVFSLCSSELNRLEQFESRAATTVRSNEDGPQP